MKIEHIKLKMNNVKEPRYFVAENRRVIKVFINYVWDYSPLRIEEYQHLYDLGYGERIDSCQFYKEISEICKEDNSN